MPIRHHRDLQCWQLANQLRKEVIAICEMEAAAKDSRFCHGFMDAVGSVCRNLSEGFSRFESAYIVQFFGYATASLSEIQDYLEECRLRRFTTQEHFDKLWDLSEHVRAAALKFERPHKERLARQRKPPPKPRRRP